MSKDSDFTELVATEYMELITRQQAEDDWAGFNITDDNWEALKGALWDNEDLWEALSTTLAEFTYVDANPDEDEIS